MLSTDYTKMFKTHGSNLFSNHIIDNNYIEIISSNLKQDYLGLDIGSNDGFYASEITNNIKKSTSFSGKILSVDPYPIEPFVIKSDGESYISTTDLMFDFIICKYSIHFIKDKSKFLSDCYKKLKPNGHIYIFTCSPNCVFPWSQSISKSFINSCSFIEDYVKDFSVKKNVVSLNKQIAKQDFVNIIKYKSISNLYSNTKEELDNCIEFILQQNDILNYILVIDIYVLDKQLF